MTVSLEEAQKSLPTLLAGLKPGDQLIITRDSQPIAQVVPVAGQAPRPQFGSCRGMLIETPRNPREAGSAKEALTILADDDEHLKDFAEYMP